VIGECYGWRRAFGRIGDDLPAVDEPPTNLRAAVLTIQDANHRAAFITRNKATQANRMRGAVDRRDQLTRILEKQRVHYKLCNPHVPEPNELNVCLVPEREQKLSDSGAGSPQRQTTPISA
jgi:hypothetical protein